MVRVDQRTSNFFHDCIVNLMEAVGRYDQCDVAGLSGRWRTGKKIAAELVLIALSRGRNHRSMLNRMGLEQKIALPSHTGRQGLPHFPLLNAHLPEGTDACFWEGIVECGTQRRVNLDFWQEEIIFDDGREKLTRQSLLWILRDKEGVAHFDLSVESSSLYSALYDRGHADFFFQKMVGELGVVFSFRGSNLHIVNKIPPEASAPPPVHAERYPLLGGIDGAIRTMATEVLVALGETDFSFDTGDKP